MAGASRSAAGSRSLPRGARIVDQPLEAPAEVRDDGGRSGASARDGALKRGVDVSRRELQAWIGEHHAAGAEIRAPRVTTSPRPVISAGRLSRQAVTSEPRPVGDLPPTRFVERAGIGSGEQPQGRSGIGRAAAKTGSNRQILDQAEAPERDGSQPSTLAASAAAMTRLSPGKRGRRTAHRRRARGRRPAQAPDRRQARRRQRDCGSRDRSRRGVLAPRA